MSRTPFKATPQLQKKIYSMAAVGVPQEVIAAIIGCSPKTLRKHFRNELDRGSAEDTAVIANTLFSMVRAGNVHALIFWNKCHGRAVSKEPDGEQSAASDDPAPPSRCVILPDNQRNPAMTERAEGIMAEARALKKKDDERKAREAQRYRAKRARTKVDRASIPDES